MTGTCPSCQEPDSGSSTCPRCGESLRVDIVVEPISDDRHRALAAKALAAMKPPLGTVADLIRALRTPDQVVARGVPKAELERVNVALFPLELGASARPAAPPGGTAWARARAPGRPPRSRAPLVAAALLTCAVLVGAAVRSFWPPAEAARSIDRATLLASVVQLQCDGELGAGFFIEPDLVLTNAHLLCGRSTDVAVGLASGQVVTGKVEHREGWRDFALLRVAGAAQPALPVGDSTGLLGGEPVAFAVNPSGSALDWQEGRIDFAGRNHVGVPYLQLEATAAVSGGPVIDTQGKVVGLVSRRVLAAEGLSLALPVEHVMPPRGAALDRWKTRLATVRALEDVAQVGASAAAALILLEAKVEPYGVTLSMLGRSSDLAARLHVQLRSSDRTLCSEPVVVQSPVPFDALVYSTPPGTPLQQELARLARQHAIRDVVGATGAITLDACPLEEVPAEPVLVLVGAAEGSDRKTLAREPLRQMAARRRAALGYVEALANGPRPQRTEAGWRKAFRDASAELLMAKMDWEYVAKIGAVEPPGAAVFSSGNHQRIAARLKAATDALAQLTRDADEASVPLDWRR